jgi:putative oxidoreductase
VGGPIHLGLAPTLLVAMLYLIWAGPGAAALDGRLDATD